MMAVFVSLGTFVVLLTLGLGVTALAHDQMSPLTRLRVSGGIGIGLYLTCAIALSQLGLPVKTFALPLTAVLFALSLIAIAIRPPTIALRDAATFILPLFVAVTIVGSPLLQFGFHWLSFSNDDMGNYSLAAERFIESGYFTKPDPAAVMAERDIASQYWGMHALDGERSGVDILLASVAAITHHTPFAVFMPVILAGFLTIVAASGALATRGSGRGVGFLIAIAVAASPLSAFGVFYQLLAQEFGLGCAVTVTALLFRWQRIESIGALVRNAVVSGAAVCGLVATYPEMAPFIGLGAIMYLGIAATRHTLRAQLGRFGLVLAFVAVFLNAHAVTMALLLRGRVIATSQNTPALAASLFPYYLLPSGFSNAWGFQPIATVYSEPLQSALIAIAVGLTGVAITATCILTLRGNTPGAFVLCGMVLFSILAVHRGEAFALYKLAMYAQPFLLTVIVCGMFSLIRALPVKLRFGRAAILATPCAILICIQVPTDAAYRAASSDQYRGSGAGFSEIPGASRRGLLEQMESLSRRYHGVALISDTANVSLGKVEAGYFRDDSLFYYASEHFAGLFSEARYPPYFGESYRTRLRFAKGLAAHLRSTIDIKSFDYTPEAPSRMNATFGFDRRLGLAKVSRAPHFLLASSGRQTVLNRTFGERRTTDIYVAPLSSAASHLSFIETDLGGAAGPSTPRARVSLFQLEPDYYYPGDTMAGAGRYMLFAVDGGSGPVQMLVDLSTSLSGDGQNRLPPIAAVGTRRIPFHVLGRGSARVLSPPVTPITIGGVRFVGIDMGTNGPYFAERRAGLMKSFGRRVRLDSRRLVSFVRDISAINTISQLGAEPHELAVFPRDLKNNALIYSGMYEDGWCGEDISVRLSASKRQHFELRFMVPLITDQSYAGVVNVTIDGKPIGQWALSLGNSTITPERWFGPGPHSISLHFTHAEALPSPDSRVVAGRVDYIGFR